MGELLGSRSVRIGMCLFLLQQASGINAIVYFSSSVFAQARRPCVPAFVRGQTWACMPVRVLTTPIRAPKRGRNCS